MTLLTLEQYFTFAGMMKKSKVKYFTKVRYHNNEFE